MLRGVFSIVGISTMRGRKRKLSSLLGAFLLLQMGLVMAQSTSKSSWKTLSGNPPAIIARGGFSGIFPDSSYAAYRFVYSASSEDTVLWCDVQLTKDGIGICLPDVILDNCTNIAGFYPSGMTNYVVNGAPMRGWFSVDYNISEISEVSLTQAIYSRTERFDASNYAILRVTDVVSQIKPPAIWLNVQHDIFYKEHNLSMRNFIISVSKQVVVNYVSSPEVGFLKSIAPRVSSKTKLIFRFLDETLYDPSTNQTYNSLLRNLTFVKTFASGILVPKNYIWPVSPDNYLLPPNTSVVTDAHKAGLEIYAADFANDNLFSYNYSFDPLAEYLSFIDNGEFSVDGVVSDFPITPSEAIGKPVIISHYGASGDYPDCTDLAYQKAVRDGADIIDCPVQVTQDSILICMSSINLMDDTNVANTQFRSRVSVVPQIQSTPGIFTFNLTWDEIQNNIQPVISSPESNFKLTRNPRYKTAGNFMKLADFLAFAKDKDLSGILISVQYAAFMAENLGFSATDAIITALSEAGYNKQTTALDVMIQSIDSSVLVNFKQKTKYKLVYMIDEYVSDALPSSLADIKTFADAVAVHKGSIYAVDEYFITNQTNLVEHLKAAGLLVYVYVLRNEFTSQPWDFFADATVEINSYVAGVGVDGLITDFPATARRYKRNSCFNLGNNTPVYMETIQAGGLLQLIIPPARPPAMPPMPALNVSDVVEPPLPPVALKPPPASPANSPHSAAARRTTASVFALLLVMLSTFLLV
uniref:glycerophosphodiester phosphodiesterase n=1 Tax=Ananas comosus var. bracteatus TaxID=296719 RepID=A0A6V7QXH6_ANACO